MVKKNVRVKAHVRKVDGKTIQVKSHIREIKKKRVVRNKSIESSINWEKHEGYYRNYPDVKDYSADMWNAVIDIGETHNKFPSRAIVEMRLTKDNKSYLTGITQIYAENRWMDYDKFRLICVNKNIDIINSLKDTIDWF